MIKKMINDCQRSFGGKLKAEHSVFKIRK